MVKDQVKSSDEQDRKERCHKRIKKDSHRPKQQSQNISIGSISFNYNNMSVPSPYSYLYPPQPAFTYPKENLKEGFEDFSQEYKNRQSMVVEIHEQQQYKHARRLYVGNIPDSIQKNQLDEWLFRSMEAAGGLLESGNPIVNLKIDQRGRFAFVELRSIEETTGAFQLDGIFLWNRQLRIKRPRQFEKYPKVKGTRPIPILNVAVLKTIGIQIIPTEVQNGPLKMYLANLPLQVEQGVLLTDLNLRSYGQLRSFHLVKDAATNMGKGYAFMSYQTKPAAQLCINTINGTIYQGKQLICKFAHRKEK